MRPWSRNWQAATEFWLRSGVFCTAILSLAAGILPAISNAAGQSAFSGTSGTILRQNLGLEGGRAEDLAIAPDGTLYIALSSPNGLFCSTDGAATWQGPPAGTDLGNVVAVDVGEESDTAYLIGGIDLYKTSDACATFDQLRPSDGAASDFDQTLVYGGGILLAAYRDGTIYRSSDGGTELTKVVIHSEVTKVISLASSPADGTFLALARTAANEKLYRSTDGGDTWSEVAAFDCSGCTEVAVDPQNASRIVAAGLGAVQLSTDGGGSWSDITPDGMAATTPSFIGSRLYIGSRYTDDGGSTWNDVNAESTSSTELFDAVTQDPGDPDTLYMISLRGIAKSTDGGVTWSDSVKGITGVQVNDIAQSSDKDTVYLAATGGLARSTDFTSGPTWTHPIDLTGNGSEISAVIIPDPANPATVLAATGAQIYRSTDGGVSFTEDQITASSLGDHVMISMISDFATTAAGDLVATFLDGDSQTGGVLVSTGDSGIWTDLSLPNGAPANAVATLGEVIVVGAGHENEESSSKRGVFRYDGSSWTKITGAGIESDIINDVLAVGGNTVYAASGGASQGTVYRSTDGGLTWEDLRDNGLPSDGWFRSLAADPGDDQVIYAASGRPAGNAVIMESTDGGDSWNLYYAGLKDEVPYAMLFDGLVAGFNTGVFAFAPVSCTLTQTGRRKLTVALTQGNQSITSLEANGISEASAILTKVKKNGKKKRRKTKTRDLDDATGTATFRVKKKGWYQATCLYTAGGDEQTVTSKRVKKRRKWKKALSLMKSPFGLSTGVSGPPIAPVSATTEGGNATIAARAHMP